MSDELMNHDPDAERAVLACCLNSSNALREARKLVTAEDFYDPADAAIWETIGRLERAGRAVDHVSVNAAMTNPRSRDRLLEVVTHQAMAANIETYASIVRSWAMKRRLHNEGIRVVQQALSPEVNAVGYAASVATRFANLRDSGLPDTTTAKTLGELLEQPDDEPDWLLPGLLERRDRLMLTGAEGGGKSYLMRQIAIMGAAGLDPFNATRIQPFKVTIIDVENSERQVKRKARPLVDWALRYGLDPRDRVVIDCGPRLDITADKSLARIHQLLDATQPDLVVIGPLYRLSPRAINGDDEAAPILTALDTIRDRDIALLIEAHAGHAIGAGGVRDMRPRGSSALLGWPEFGYGMRPSSPTVAEMVPWRGDRDERGWPDCLRREHDGPRWLPVDANYADLATA